MDNGFLVRFFIRNQQVAGSSPASSSKKYGYPKGIRIFCTPSLHFKLIVIEYPYENLPLTADFYLYKYIFIVFFWEKQVVNAVNEIFFLEALFGIA